jgi:hypothetical protein
MTGNRYGRLAMSRPGAAGRPRVARATSVPASCISDSSHVSARSRPSTARRPSPVPATLNGESTARQSCHPAFLRSVPRQSYRRYSVRGRGITADRFGTN